MKLKMIVLSVLLAGPASASSLLDIAGEWVVDLRVNAATDKPYTQPMILKLRPIARSAGASTIAILSMAVRA